uniref:Enoyl reductase (ER) domain-containing protein n=1 Tax=Branchiostoma floridae TaxID=7739 RepID=C3Y6B4_BRAFL|eukprot:XP_002608501.1 hypothetical protein BRAFLDRAFT_92417 [Branchiostoma floridae]
MAAQVPKAFQRLMVSSLTPKFRNAISLETVPMAKPGPKEVVVKNRFVGINASDVNFAAGRYDPTKAPPFQIGFEGLGVVAAAGAESNFKVGQPVAYLHDGAFTEYKVLPTKFAIPLPSLKAEYIPLMVSGLTAAISFDEVTAAGGTGQFAVQLAKKAGCHVIGTCSTDAKMEFLKSIGCDRPINYKKEDLNEVLKTEYPKGVDVVYESVGAQMFDTCVNRLALKGRLIVIGFITGYKSDTGYTPIRGGATLPPKQRGSHVSTYRCKLYHKYNLLGEDNGVIMIVLQFPHTPLIGGNFKSMTKHDFRHFTGVLEVQLPCKLVVRRRPQTSEPAPRGALHAPRRFGSLCCYGNRPFGRPARAELYRLEPFERPAPGRRPKAFEPCRPGPVRDVVRASPSGQSGPFMAVRTVLRTVERPSRPTDPSDPRTIAWFELMVHAGSD